MKNRIGQKNRTIGQKGEYINLVGKNAEYEEHRKKNNCHWVSSNIVQSANKISDQCTDDADGDEQA